MSYCKQKVEVFINKALWDKTPIDQYYDNKKKDYLKIIQSNEKADFIIELEGRWVRFTFGYIIINVPKERFLIEAGTVLTDLAVGKNFISHMLKEDRKERRKRRFKSWFTKQKRNQ